MGTKYKVNNKSNKPDNIVTKSNLIVEDCIVIEKRLPKFMRDYFLYLKSSVAPSTRRAYLQDIQFFCNYLVETQELTAATDIKDITIEDFQGIKARDINLFLGDYCSRYSKLTSAENKIIFENDNRALARKKSSISVLFKFLYRNEQLKVNITDGLNPIKLPKPQPDAIKRLEIDEVARLLEVVDTGEGLTETEKKYWRKTRLRDKAIMAMFVTYGLRLSELRELNISSFSFSRGEFMIYRKRGKEVLMPINNTCESVIKEYINFERAKSELLDEEYKDALFLSLQGRRIDMKSIRNLVKKYTSIVMETSRNKGYSPHKLRATAATSLIQEGFSIYDVQNLLDHDNVTTTQLYAAHKKNVKRDIVTRFEWLDDQDTEQDLDEMLEEMQKMEESLESE